MNTPYVSIIMSAYKPLKHDIDTTIHSVLNQTFHDFEFIILKDDDLPDTLLLLREWADKDIRIKVIDNVKNIGLIASLNKGLDHAAGSLISRIDVGDWWEFSKLEKQVNLFHSDPALHLCGTSLVLVDAEHHPIGYHNAQTTDTEITKQLMEGSNPFAHSSVMFRKTPFRYNSKALYCEDFELWCRYSQIGSMANIGEPLTHYLIDTSGITGQKRSLMIENTTRIYCFFLNALTNNNFSFLEKGIPITPKETISYLQKISNQWYSKAIAASLNHQYLQKNGYLVLAVLSNPALIWNKMKRLYCKRRYL